MMNSGRRIIDDPITPVIKMRMIFKKITMNGSTKGLTMVPNLLTTDPIVLINANTTYTVMITGTVIIKPCIK